MSLAVLENTTTSTTHEGMAAETCYAMVRELIMDAVLLPNTHHLETSLAVRLGVDVLNVHQAALRLHDEGVVTVEPRGGFWVAPLSPQTVIGVFSQLSKLEARAAYVAALHGADVAGMAMLDDAIRRMEDALFRKDVNRWASADHHFHRSLVQTSGVSELIAAALPLSEATHHARMIALTIGPLPVEQTQCHAMLVDAIRRGSATEARDRHVRYWKNHARNIIDLLQLNRMDRMSA